MRGILEIPELCALDGQAGLIRIPNQIDVPVTPRVLRILDTVEFQRLKQISQLGMVSFVYPAANHNRFEHSLGVYRNSLLFLRQFARQEKFTSLVSSRDAEVLILAALLHDVGHWPYCHPIEDIQIEGLRSHESFASEYIKRDSIASCLKEDWQVEPQAVIDVINKKKDSPVQAVLSSILSGPIDIDKLDYLYRDSLHAGVPYGQNFDALRLIRSLCLNENSDRLAITSKGRTAAELMVFARYVMFSEVYWHHAVRSATAMFQRAFFLWHQQVSGTAEFDGLVNQMFESSEFKMIELMIDSLNGAAKDSSESEKGSAKSLLEKLFGPNRQLYKRVANYSFNENELIYKKIAQKPYGWLVACSEKLVGLIENETAKAVDANAILIDAPPVGLEVQFNVDVYYSKTDSYRKLGEVSPVVNTLAKQQFDDFVKQVRIFASKEVVPIVKMVDLDSLIKVAIGEVFEFGGPGA